MVKAETAKQFHKCNAFYDYVKNTPMTCLVVDGKDRVNGINDHVFWSYHSVIMVIDYKEETIYMLPRYKYSATTSRQRNRFIRENGLEHYSVVMADGYKSGGLMRVYTY